MTEHSTEKYHRSFRWGTFMAAVLLIFSIVFLTPLFAMGSFAPIEFWAMLLLPQCVCVYQVLVKKSSLSEWPILALSLASAWYVWFAWLSMYVDPTDIDMGHLIVWGITGGITPLVLYKLVAAIRHNRWLFALVGPLIIAMSVGFLHFLGELRQLVLNIAGG